MPGSVSPALAREAVRWHNRAMIRDEIPRSAPGRSRPAGEGDPGFGIYVHWPFCLSKCPYCDFNSHVAKPGADASRWRTALKLALQRQGDKCARKPVTSVFFGGGTPSLMPPQIVGDV